MSLRDARGRFTRAADYGHPRRRWLRRPTSRELVQAVATTVLIFMLAKLIELSPDAAVVPIGLSALAGGIVIMFAIWRDRW